MKTKKPLSKEARAKKLSFIKKTHKDKNDAYRNRIIYSMFKKLDNVYFHKDSIKSLLDSLKAQFFSKGKLTNTQYKTLLKIVENERDFNRVDYKYDK